MELLELKNLEYFDVVYESYLNEFPFEERKSKEKLLRMFSTNKYSYYLLFDNQKVVAYTFFIKDDEKKLIFIDYIAVIKEYQNNGYGTVILNILKDKYSTYAIILEIEKPDGNINSITERRKRFYIKNNAFKLDVDYKLPTINGYLDMDLMMIKNNHYIYKEVDLKNFLKDSITFIHDDFTHTIDLINMYINSLPKKLK